MRLQYCSDLHLEFPENRKFIKDHPLQPKGDILLLAGDIVPFSIMEQQNHFFDYVSDRFEVVYWLPGNHEFYSGDAAIRSGTLYEKIRKNVFLVNNISFKHDEVKLVFSTLWSRISPINEWTIQQSLNDFHVITFNGNRFSPSHVNQLHSNCVRFLQQEINQKNAEKTVVVSHHVPTFLNYPKMYKGSALNEGFGTEMFDFIEDSDINYWIYGHHHCNTPAFSIGRTTLLTNQLGYVEHKEHRLFDLANQILI